MKIWQLRILGLFTLFILLTPQTIFGQWNGSNGSPTTSTTYTINRSGKVGIGLNSSTGIVPLSQLHVIGEDNSYDATTNKYYGALRIGSSANSGNLFLDENEIDSNSSYGLNLNNNSPQKVVLANGGGNVGIGVPSPLERLHIDGAIRGNQTGGAVRINTDYGYLDIGPKTTGWTHFATSSSNKFYFSTEMRVNSGLIGSYDEDLNLRTEGITRMTISNTDGNVGIGVVSPLEKLHIDGAIRGNQTGGALRINTEHGFLDIGPQNSGWTHFMTSSSKFYFDREIWVNSGRIGSLDEDLQLRTGDTTRMTISNTTGDVSWGNGNGMLSTDNGASLKLGGSGTPYIDLINDNTGNYDLRLELQNDSTLRILRENMGTSKLLIEGVLEAKKGVELDAYRMKSIIEGHDSNNYLSIFNANDTLAKGLFYSPQGRLIIGTTDPCGRNAEGYDLNVKGAAKIDSLVAGALTIDGIVNYKEKLLFDNEYEMKTVLDGHDNATYFQISRADKAMYFTEKGQLIIGTTDPCGRSAEEHALSVKGTAKMDSAISHLPNFTIISDQRLKKNINLLEDNSLDKFNLVKLYEYEYKKNIKGRRLGIMAQEMKEILPSTVGTFKGENGEKYYNFNPSDLHFLHMKATQELSKKVEDQEVEIESLKEENENLNERLSNMEKQMNDIYQLLAQKEQANPVNSLNANLMLGQNIPNPSTDETIIPFNIPQNVNNVILTITDIQGNTVLEQKVQASDNGHLKINTYSFAKGTYVYFLTVNGQMSNTRKMIIE